MIIASKSQDTVAYKVKARTFCTDDDFEGLLPLLLSEQSICKSVSATLDRFKATAFTTKDSAGSNSKRSVMR